MYPTYPLSIHSDLTCGMLCPYDCEPRKVRTIVNSEITELLNGLCL